MAHSLYITGLFNDRAQAEKAYQGLLARGYEAAEISLVMSEETKQREFSHPPNTELAHKVAEGAEVVGALGGTLAALAAALATLGSTVALPAMGLALNGPLATALTSAGASGGHWLDALIGWGVPESHVHGFEDELHRGSILIAVRAHSAAEHGQIEREWHALSTPHTLPTSKEAPLMMA